jgi:hypothetical protein
MSESVSVADLENSSRTAIRLSDDHADSIQKRNTSWAKTHDTLRTLQCLKADWLSYGSAQAKSGHLGLGPHDIMNNLLRDTTKASLESLQSSGTTPASGIKAATEAIGVIEMYEKTLSETVKDLQRAAGDQDEDDGDSRLFEGF